MADLITFLGLIISSALPKYSSNFSLQSCPDMPFIIILIIIINVIIIIIIVIIIIIIVVVVTFGPKESNFCFIKCLLQTLQCCGISRYAVWMHQDIYKWNWNVLPPASLWADGASNHTSSPSPHSPKGILPPPHTKSDWFCFQVSPFCHCSQTELTLWLLNAFKYSAKTDLLLSRLHCSAYIM